MRIFRILNNSLKDAFKSVFRNFSLSVASITCSTITLILVGIAIILMANVNAFTKDLKEELTIVVFLKRGTTIEQANLIKTQIEAIDNIDKNNITFYSNEDVKNDMQLKYDVFDSIMNKWTPEDNFLQHEFEVKVLDVNEIKKTSEEIGKLEMVDVTKYGEEMVDQLVLVFDAVEKISIIIVASLIVVTAFLISNTIKLTIYSRKTEIEIMRLIGTSNSVIRLPFVFEGLFLGIIGAIIPIILVVYGYTIAYDKLGGYLFSKIITMINPGGFIIYVALVILGIAALVGMVGSYRAVRKYLKI